MIDSTNIKMYRRMVYGRFPWGVGCLVAYLSATRVVSHVSSMGGERSPLERTAKGSNPGPV